MAEDGGHAAAREPGLHVEGEVALGFPPPQRSYARVAYANTQPDVQKARWLTVRPDGSVVAYAGKVEYGQGIRTGLAIEVADELRVPIASVEVVLGDTARVPWDMGTFGSQSTARVGLQLRKAAATARQALLERASDMLDLPADELRVASGCVSSVRDGGRSVTYAELIAGESLLRDVDDEIALTPSSEFSIMGTPQARIDAEARVTGRAVFSQDVVADGMLFAAVLRPPWRGADLQQVDVAAANGMPGVVEVVQDDGLTAVLADSDEHAAAAAIALRAEWSEAAGLPSSIDLAEILVSSGHDPFVTQEAGSLEEGFAAAAGSLEATYFLPYVSNAPMEPRAAVATWEGDRLTVWAGTVCLPTILAQENLIPW